MSIWNIIVLGKTGSGKSSFLNAIIKSFGSSLEKLLETSDDTDGCTTDLEPVNIFYNNKHLCFYDTPGLDDGNEDQNNGFINLLRNEGRKTENRINCILICINAVNARFDGSLRDTLIEIMNCYPLDNFWEHVIIIKTHILKDIYKKPGNIEQAIKKNKKITAAMNKKGINFPSCLKEYYINSVNDDQTIKTDDDIKIYLKSLFTNIIKMDPFFKEVKELEVKDEDEGNLTITYQYLEYTDFDGKKNTKRIKLNSKPKVMVVGKRGPFCSERKYGSEYKKCGKRYQDYKRYQYYIDENNKECDHTDIGEVIRRRV